ncbi:small nuclear ribonucleoprotein E isoform X2 [Syngnathoides biaculeatus]|uniref:small nuclear ribonucleoprotein E isoform X2 n=1 Tax=Syngnathoides biaculeatus TaxID=300417 RepID=UPI002ADE5FC9|nr:small nuclear ribonucleoprotein E isoform X2 [Syngnathoides biaculeatus]
MAYRGQGQKVQKVMVQPINLIFRYLQNRSRIQVWLYEQVNIRIEGCIIGFDEYMNLVLEDSEEVHMKTRNRKPLGNQSEEKRRSEPNMDKVDTAKIVQTEVTVRGSFSGHS